MAQRYRKTRSASNRDGREASRNRRPQIVGRVEALADRVALEVPVSRQNSARPVAN